MLATVLDVDPLFFARVRWERVTTWYPRFLISGSIMLKICGIPSDTVSPEDPLICSDLFFCSDSQPSTLICIDM